MAAEDTECCFSFLTGDQMLLREESERCLRSPSLKIRASSFSAFELYETGRFSGGLDCLLGNLKIGSNSALAVKFRSSQCLRVPLSCGNGVHVANTSQLTYSHTCMLDYEIRDLTGPTTVRQTQRAGVQP